MTSKPESRVTVLVAEDHELARYGLVLTLEERPDVAVVGEAENGREAVERAKQHRPDVVLMDIGMPVVDGIAATRKIKAERPETKVIMLTSRKHPEEIYAAFASGADGYCMKDIKVDRLCQVIDLVMAGGVWLDPAIAETVVQALPTTPTAASTEKPAAATRQRYNTHLTEREMEVLQLLALGKSNKEIAQALGVTSHTAKAHVSSIIQKLAVDDRTQVAIKALQEGLVPSTD